LLSDERKALASVLSERVCRELRELGMGQSAFSINVMEEQQGPYPAASYGFDRVEFLLSANPGEPARPLSRIASGGEISRVMLALKVVFAGADRVPTLVFDEIDSGIGGATADAVAKKLSEIAQSRQVICVTHLPIIASAATTHFFILKEVEGGRTRTKVRKLSHEERICEIARMLAGERATELTRRQAAQLLGLCGHIK